MKCMACGGQLGTVQTVHPPGEQRVWRQRRCRSEGCTWTTTTQEVSAAWFKEAQALMNGLPASVSGEVVPLQRPLPTPPAAPLADLEAMLDEKVVDAVDCVGRSLAEGAKPDRTQVELARWLIDDRRAYRRELLTQGGDDDGGMTGILSLLPDAKGGQ